MTLMRDEIDQIPAVAARILEDDNPAFAAFADQRRKAPPSLLVSVGRGSSAHAGAYGGYLAARLTGTLLVPMQPSLASVHATRLHCPDGLAIAVSQSGQSPDILQATQALQKGGAQTVAIVNDLASPLAGACDLVFSQWAQPERAVAATKSFVGSLVALARLMALWSQDHAINQALPALPARLDQATRCDWGAGIAGLTAASQMFVIGRGASFPIAQEAGLKLKETCLIQAEPFSAAEVHHGPRAVVEAGYKIVGFALPGADLPTLSTALASMRDFGADVFVAGAALPGTTALPMPPSLHPLLDPIIAITAFYGLAEALSIARGLSPDAPRNLSKVTETV